MWPYAWVPLSDLGMAHLFTVQFHWGTKGYPSSETIHTNDDDPEESFIHERFVKLMKRLLIPFLLLFGGMSHAALVREGSITLSNGEAVSAAVIDAAGGFAYFEDSAPLTGTVQTVHVTRVQLSNFSETSFYQDIESTQPPVGISNNAAVIDPLIIWLISPTNSRPPRSVKIICRI